MFVRAEKMLSHGYVSMPMADTRHAPSPSKPDMGALRLAVAFGAALGLAATFVMAAITGPRFETIRSDQTAGLLERNVPTATLQVFERLAKVETCATRLGHGAGEGIPPVRSETRGLSYAAASIWREDCGGMSLTIPLRDASSGSDANALRATFQSVTAQVMDGRLSADNAARQFHGQAYTAGVPYRLVGWDRWTP